ncbi:MAG: penicillin-binding transpeptidase domain-containing protein [Firmicutes bacterium]|nr:penicillin-binding transpeptidase domain-containing protein [Bacillota bacterium]
MKKVRNRAWSVLVIILALMIGVSYFTFRFFTEGNDWVNFSANKHIYSNGVLIGGAIYDSNGEPLVHTVDGKRKYSENKNVRCATMHIIGDKKSNISTSLQKVYADELMGYNLINGMYSVDGTGKKLYTTLNSDVCAAAYQQLKGKKGTVGVYNYKTGEIICLVSTPTYDPENPPKIQSGDNAYDGVYINRLLSSKFTPGSVYKLITSAAAIDTVDDIFERTFTCKGETVVNGQTIKCSGTHGKQNFQQALKNSCNVAFAEISVLVGWENMTAYAQKAGITQSHDVSGIKTIKGSIPTSGEKNELAWTGIGQHTDEVNPFAMMRYVGAIANGGVVQEPYLVKKITTSGGMRTSFMLNKNTTRCLSEYTANTLAKMMRFNVTNGYNDKNYPEGMEFCAKTGTAELDGNQKSHAWFAGFCQNEKYPYAFVVCVQNGGSGKAVAGKIASNVMAEVKNQVDNKR